MGAPRVSDSSLAMPIDFHDPATRTTYAQRLADNSWSDTMTGLVDPHGTRVADIGCGGGIYSTAWLNLGAASVVGVDFSEQMILAARSRAAEQGGLSFVAGDATDAPYSISTMWFWYAQTTA